jgi:hypothetical protein
LWRPGTGASAAEFDRKVNQALEEFRKIKDPNSASWTRKDLAAAAGRHVAQKFEEIQVAVKRC